jgi:hypothetical protein
MDPELSRSKAAKIIDKNKSIGTVLEWIRNCAFQIYIGVSNSSLKALTAPQSRNRPECSQW